MREAQLAVELEEERAAMRYISLSHTHHTPITRLYHTSSSPSCRDLALAHEKQREIEEEQMKIKWRSEDETRQVGWQWLTTHDKDHT